MRNLLFFTAFLLMSSIAYSQLYVTPNTSTSTDSYIYVTDGVLFVEGEINLVANTFDATTEASIYLREQAQLIQGTPASANSGTGFISVIQNTPDDDAWDYTFWGSPVGNYITGSGNENFGILRIHDSITETDSNVTLTLGGVNGIESPLTISRRWMYRYPAGGPWTALGAETNNNVIPGYGFIMKGVGTTNHNQKYDFRGRPNNGDMTVSLTANKSTLSGNPYPSALDLNRVFYETGNEDIESFRFWDEDRSVDSHLYTRNKGGYGVWTPGGSDYNGFTPGLYTFAPFLNYDQGGNPSGGQTGDGGLIQRRFAPIGQGFMVYPGASAPNGSFTIKNEHRRYIVEGVANNSQFRTPTGGNSNSSGSASGGITPTIPNNQLPLIRIHTIFGDSHYRDMILAFSNEATDGYDRGFDARHPMDATAEAYFPIGPDNDRKPYVIQTVPFEIGKRIPITFELDQQFKFSVKAVEEINISNAAYLFDRLENTYQKITGGKEAQLLLPAGEYDDRFFIVFRGPSDVITPNLVGNELENNVRSSFGFFQNNPVKQLEISNPEGYDIITAHIFDMTGKLVVNKSNIGTSRNFTFSTANLSDGVYLVKLITLENIDVNYKIVIHNN
ncbi:MAG: T9SS type A sorting domain-containing protein [Bacteroidetes bacterium]|nr:T9SS type A sorting domain-containing protein [Bacteroidota bacterium]